MKGCDRHGSSAHVVALACTNQRSRGEQLLQFTETFVRADFIESLRHQAAGHLAGFHKFPLKVSQVESAVCNLRSESLGPEEAETVVDVPHVAGALLFVVPQQLTIAEEDIAP